MVLCVGKRVCTLLYVHHDRTAGDGAIDGAAAVGRGVVYGGYGDGWSVVTATVNVIAALRAVTGGCAGTGATACKYIDVPRGCIAAI